MKPPDIDTLEKSLYEPWGRQIWKQQGCPILGISQGHLRALIACVSAILYIKISPWSTVHLNIIKLQSGAGPTFPVRNAYIFKGGLFDLHFSSLKWNKKTKWFLTGACSTPLVQSQFWLLDKACFYSTANFVLKIKTCWGSNLSATIFCCKWSVCGLTSLLNSSHQW